MIRNYIDLNISGSCYFIRGTDLVEEEYRLDNLSSNSGITSPHVSSLILEQQSLGRIILDEIKPFHGSTLILEQPSGVTIPEEDVSLNISTSQSSTERNFVEQQNKEFEDTIIRLINISDFEYGFCTPAEEYIRLKLKDNGTFIRERLECIFIRNINNPGLLCGLLRIISHFSYNEMRPQGMMMATNAIANRDIEVKECGVRCFESWREKEESVSLLQSMDIEEDWLREYVEKVINYLKK